MIRSFNCRRQAAPSLAQATQRGLRYAVGPHHIPIAPSDAVITSCRLVLRFLCPISQRAQPPWTQLTMVLSERMSVIKLSRAIPFGRDRYVGLSNGDRQYNAHNVPTCQLHGGGQSTAASLVPQHMPRETFSIPAAGLCTPETMAADDTLYYEVPQNRYVRGQPIPADRHLPTIYFNNFPLGDAYADTVCALADHAKLAWPKHVKVPQKMAIVFSVCRHPWQGWHVVLLTRRLNPFSVLVPGI